MPEKTSENKIISISTLIKELQCLATNTLTGLDFLQRTVCIPLYYFDSEGNRIDNITNWGLNQFREHFKDYKIEKTDIFNYTYAVLHNPKYRKKYELNLKRDFLRIPYYSDFRKWVNWGRELIDLHINYETVAPYKLKIVEEKNPKNNPKPKLQAIPSNGEIILDENTIVENIPDLAWEYKFGNRSALHWVIDQYKEKKIKR